MGVRNYLIEGGSVSGKTSVCDELSKRGFQSIHGDRELAYQGDPVTGRRIDPARRRDDAYFIHRHHLWDVDRVRSLVADKKVETTFLCGGSRNSSRFIDLFDIVFILRIDGNTLERRLAARPPGEWGVKPEEAALVRRLHSTGEEVPTGIEVDATKPIGNVVDEILAHISARHPIGPRA